MRVVIADDQTAVREGLVTLLGLMPGVEVVGAAGDGAEAVAMVAERRPDVVLMDLRMPNMDGVAATAAIRAEFPATQVVVLTTYADDESILGALAAGALGYLTKDAGREAIGRALDAAASGQAVLDPGVRTALLNAALVRAPLPVPRRRAPLPAPRRRAPLPAIAIPPTASPTVSSKSCAWWPPAPPTPR